MPLELLQRQGLSKSAAVILGVIIDRCTDQLDGCAQINQKDMATTSGYDPRTVRRALIELEALELIEHERTGRASRYKLTGCVELLPPKQRGTRKQQERAEREAQERETREMLEEYTALANRFKEDYA